MPKRKNSLLSIDPGRHTGFALWNHKNLLTSGAINGNEDTEETFIFEMSEKFEDIIKMARPGIVLIEGAAMWSANPISVMSANKRKNSKWETGDLFVLAYLIGAYIRTCIDYGIDYKIIYPRMWKGNMGKPATKKRVIRSLGYEIKNEHEIDAIGIALGMWKIL